MIKNVCKLLPAFRNAVVLFVKSRSSMSLHCHDEDDLACACAITSRSLVYFLMEDLGINAKLCLGIFDPDGVSNPKLKCSDDINHAWVEIGKYIIDLTASQFGSSVPHIIVTKKTDKRYLKIGETSHKSLKDFNEWPHQQIPKKVYVNKILQNYRDLSTAI